MSTSKNDPNRATSTNPDPITGEPGSHPIGTGLGAAGAGAAAGAAGGAVAGPVGAAVGAVIGAVAGGLAGKGVAESIDPTAEDKYWRDNHASSSYATKEHGFEHYQPAYKLGYESRSLHGDKPWSEVESELRTGWEKNRGTSKLDWDHARHATRAAWDRVGSGKKA